MFTKFKNWPSLQSQVTADRKHVVLQTSHCLSSSGSNSKAARSASVVPYKTDNGTQWHENHKMRRILTRAGKNQFESIP